MDSAIQKIKNGKVFGPYSNFFHKTPLLALNIHNGYLLKKDHCPDLKTIDYQIINNKSRGTEAAHCWRSAA